MKVIWKFEKCFKFAQNFALYIIDDLEIIIDDLFQPRQFRDSVI